MEYWEFLLQKEGDRSWLPLEGPIAGILEGRYRIVARSSYRNASVNFTVSYQGQSDTALINGPQEYQRAVQTNQDGLMVVLPFTALKPGEWRFECRPAPTSEDESPDASAPTWHHEICLQVDPYEEEDPWIEASFSQGDLSKDMTAVLNGNGLGAAAPTPPLATPAIAIPELSSIAEGAAPLATSGLAEVLDSPELNPAGLAPPSGPERNQSPEGEGTDASESSAVETVNETAIATPPDDDTDSAPTPPSSLPEPPLLQTAEAVRGPEAVLSLSPEIDLPEQESPEAESPEADPADITEAPIAEATAMASEMASEVAPEAASEATSEATSGATSEAIAPPATDSEPPLLATLPGDITIQLDRATYITAWGEHITLSGTLEPNQSELLGASIPATCQLSAILRDPATQQVLVNLHMPLLQALEGDRPVQTIPLPCRFSFPVELPLETTTYLLLGELSAHALANSTAQPLTQKTFTVAADIDILAKAVNPGFTPETCSNPDQVPGAPTTQHPTFATPGDQRQKPSLDLQLLSFVSAPDGSTKPLPSPASKAVSPSPSEPPSAPPTETTASTAEPPPPSLSPDLSPGKPSSLPTPTFGTLTPQRKSGRFWTRLSAFAQDPQGAGLEAYQTEQAAPPKPEPTAPDAHLTAREILIDPDLDAPLSPAQNPSDSSAPTPLPPQNLPTPTLTLPGDSLVCGKPIAVQLQVTELPERRIGLKFWIQDRQTRQLLEPPRWVLDLLPNGRGGLESRVTVTVPPGLLEVQFEAIAIDLDTQRTGQKVSQACRCTPTDRPTRTYPLPNDGNQLFGSDL